MRRVTLPAIVLATILVAGCGDPGTTREDGHHARAWGSRISATRHVTGRVRAGAGPAALVRTPANVLVARGRTEPVVAVDQHRPRIVVVGSNTNYDIPVGGSLPPGYFTSRDAGHTFLHGNVPLVGRYSVGADPSVSIARDGTVFFGYLGESPSYCSEGGAAVEVTHSIDHGISFRRPAIVDADPNDDKPTIGIRNVPGRPSHVFVSWNRDTNSSSSIWFARSTNAGGSFSHPIRLHTGNADFGSVPVAGPNNRVFVFWAISGNTPASRPSPTHIYMRRSIDDGVHFGPAVAVSPLFWTVPSLAQPGSLRILTEPSVVIDSRGTIYLTWAAAQRSYKNGAVDADILVSRSSNGGASWSRPIRVNSVRHGDRFMPAIAVLRAGSVGLVWYDRRNHPWELDVFAARVSFGRKARVTGNLRLNRTYSSTSDILYIAPGSTCFSPGRFFGDYIGASAYGNRLYAVWSDTQLHVSQETEVWIAKVNL